MLAVSRGGYFCERLSTMSDTPLPSTGEPEIPPWALSYADAALRCGHKSAAVEESLVKKGLPASQAPMAVHQCLEKHLHDKVVLERRRKRDRRINQIASLLIVLLFASLAAMSRSSIRVYQPFGQFLMGLGGCLLPLACIWFPYIMAEAELKSRRARILPGISAPPFILVLGGWLQLLAPFIILTAGFVGERYGGIFRWLSWTLAFVAILTMVVVAFRKSWYSPDAWETFRKQGGQGIP